MAYRTHHCGELRIADQGKEVELSGWVAKNRDFGGLTFIDLRDRYGITQLSFNDTVNPELLNSARGLGREFVIQVKGIVKERESKNKKYSYWGNRIGGNGASCFKCSCHATFHNR